MPLEVRKAVTCWPAMAVLASIACAVVFGVAPASSQVPTPEQLRLMNSLPPEQIEQMLEQFQQMQTAPQPGAQAGPGALDQTETREIPFDQSQDSIFGFEPRLEAGATIIADFALPEVVPGAPPVLTDPERLQLTEFADRLVAGNPYDLDGTGQLYLPGVPAIALAGLTTEEAAVRVRAEGALRNFDVTVTYLPLEPVGVAALEPFGYDLFVDFPTTFAPAADMPVPAEYVIGPGDTVNVQLFGNVNAEYNLVVSREGAVNFPAIGPINVGGLTFAEMREVITQRVAEQLIGARSSITLGELRAIRVFVLGDVVAPGSYTVSGLSTMTNALFVSGGVQEIGTLRRIELKRDGETIATLDLYDLLLRGDTSGDTRLQPGDVIFVPPIGSTVSVAGNVRRPAIYELRDEQSIRDIVQRAGGLRPTADQSALKLERLVSGQGMEVVDIDFGSAQAQEALLEDGDVVRVPASLEQLDDGVRLAGNVFQPGLHEFSDGMLLTDLLPGPDRVRPFSDLNYVLIRREVEPNVFVEALSVDLQAAWAQPGGPADERLRPRDTVYVFNLEIGRRYVIEPLLNELMTQAPPRQAISVASVGGQVRAPGEYPLEPDMRVSDMLRAGGGLTESAYLRDAELTRYEVVNGEYRETGVLTVDIAAILAGDLLADFPITPHDYLNVKEVPLWGEQESIELLGEVRFPGIYPIRRGETLSSVLERAGGVTDFAFLQGGVFTRIELRERERDQLETLARRLENDLAAMALTEPGAGDAISTGQTLIEQIRQAVPTGRLVIQLDNIVAGVPNSDVVLRNGDRLILPAESQEITVLGEVQYATSHLYQDGLLRDDYVQRSGGLTARADERRIYVVRANGEVLANPQSRWFNRRFEVDVRAGDTVVVPLDVDRGQGLARWSQITQIIYNTAIAAAAVQSF